jgi:hypothetical protein
VLLRVVACPPAVLAEKNAVFVRHVVANLGRRSGREQLWWNGPCVVQMGVGGIPVCGRFRSVHWTRTATGSDVRLRSGKVM